MTDKPEYFVKRTLVDGKVRNAAYWPNRPGGIHRELHNYGRGNITIETFFEAHETLSEEPTSLRELDQMERDLLRLSTKQFKEKYPNSDLLDTYKTSEQVEEEMRREETARLISLMS